MILQTTIETAIREATKALSEAGVANAANLAHQIASEATNWSPAQILLHANETFAPEAARRFDELLARAVKREPLSRILKQREFYGRMFDLNDETLDPRPDTETLVDAILDLSRENRWRDRPFRFLDIGTGTGCLAITLLKELPNARALATDISNAALQAARQNAARHKVEDRLKLMNCSALNGLKGPFDLLVSNPPYIPSSEIETLSPEVALFDPRAALDGGTDGLQIYRQIARGLIHVVPDGWAAFEIGANQAGDVLSILAPSTKSKARTWMDLSGHTRCVAIRTHNA